MKPSRLNIKWKIFVILIGFIVAALGLLWALQLGMVNSISRFITINQLKRTADSIIRNIDNENVAVLAENLSYRNNVSVVVIDEGGNIIIQTQTRASLITQLGPDELSEKFKKAQAGGGVLVERDTLPLNENLDDMGFEGREASQADHTAECYIYTKAAADAGGNKLAVIVEATSLPVPLINATTTVQLLVITIFMVGATFVLAYLMSRVIATPIASLNISAKELAKGKPDVAFEGGGYKEIEELRDSLNIASKELSKIEHYRRELIANISHDLKTPLTLIKGYTEMMRDLPCESTPENIQVVIDETERLTRLVNDMLDLSKLQSGAPVLKLEGFDLVALTGEIVMRYSKMLEGKGYKFEYQHDKKAIVKGDKAKISQVIYNLISNAVNYCGEDKLIRIREYRRGSNARLDVIDNGEGIDVKILPYIWDRYYKSEKAHRRAEAGSGLGLSIVKNVMSMHPGGIYGVESSIGHGSRFYFELPLAEE
ncbi:MAG TPA: HAMP domain-containing sensor histidine kinase [Clostridia bacterium]|nr:HAMP domain-containing sensor histidine kinase [Clostridia bacterium]HPO53614.1 HAMP domain-containing sensor histidine kinase [Clostridia bacterium]